jgi:hypothetical protein
MSSEDADDYCCDPFTNTDITKGFIVRQSPAGKPEFAVQFDVKNFKPEEVKVSTKDGKLEITGVQRALLFCKSCVWFVFDF